MAGIPNRKEKRAAVARSKLINRPAVSVEPDRDTPGIIAIASAKPITTPSCHRNFSKGRRWVPTFSAKANNNDITIEAIAIVVKLCRGELSKSGTKILTNKPKKIIGNVPSPIPNANLNSKEL